MLAYVPPGTLSGPGIASGRFLWLACSKLRTLAAQIEKYSVREAPNIWLYLACISHASRYTPDTTRFRDPKRSNIYLSEARESLKSATYQPWEASWGDSGAARCAWRRTGATTGLSKQCLFCSSHKCISEDLSLTPRTEAFHSRS